MSDSTPRLPAHPSHEQLCKRAKELLRQLRNNDAAAIERLRKYKPILSDPILADAQFVLAREHGFENWQKLTEAVAQIQISRTADGYEQAARDFVDAYRGDLAALERKTPGSPLPPLSRG